MDMRRVAIVVLAGGMLSGCEAMQATSLAVDSLRFVSGTAEWISAPPAGPQQPVTTRPASTTPEPKPTQDPFPDRG